METRRWINQSQPQMMVIATFILYFNAFFGLFSIGSFFGLAAVTGAAAAYGIANEAKWGYLLGIAVAAAPFALNLLIFGNPLAGNFVNTMFDIALLVLLLHPQSREYERIWFK